MSAVKHSVRFPGESAAYRKSRNELLQDEAALRSKIESVAAKRRKLPLGGEPPEDYAFDADGKKTCLSQLFNKGKDTLVVYSFMYGSQMDQPCPL